MLTNATYSRIATIINHKSTVASVVLRPYLEQHWNYKQKELVIGFTQHYNMAATSAHKIQDEKFKSLGFSKAIVNKEQVCCYSRGLGTVSEQNPILVLIHGYPQSSYM